MTEQAPEQQPETQSAEQPQEGGEQQQSEEQLKTFDAEYVEKLRRENAKYRTEAKSAHSELEKIRKSSMSEAEKAAAEAEERGRMAAATEFGKRLARTEFDAVAGRRNADFDTKDIFEWLDLGKFVGEDGEPDAKAIKAAVERLVPVPADSPPSYDGGSRMPASAPTSMTGLIRKAAGRA